MKPTEEISAVCYDEINLSEKADCDLKYDLYIPPYKEANIFFVRSFTNQLLKMPCYILHDSAYTKPTYMEILRVLENLGLKVVSQTCDQGTRNRNLGTYTKHV